MNQEKLSHIATFPSEITAEDARELDELTRNFPFFTLPYVLLTKFYSNSNDYRFEETLHKTALRVPDRKWLFEFLHQVPAEVNEATEVTETVEQDFQPFEINPGVSEIAEELTADLDATPPENEQDIEAEKSGEKFHFSDNPEMTVSPETKESEGLLITADVSESAEELDFVVQGNMIEIDKEISQITEDFPVYDEIISFDPENYPESESPAGIEVLHVKESSEIPDINLPALMVTPDIGESKDLISEGSEDTKKEVNPVKPILTTGAVYNIEDYYPAVKSTEPPSDFFSWLSKPDYEKSDGLEETAAKKENKKTELIDRFIKNNPSVSRPKAEFYNAADVAKRSESLPTAIVTETLATVYIKQENYSGAIRIYESLILKFPEKRAYFAALIEKIKKDHHL